MQLKKIVKYLEKKFPSKKAEEWDKVGFQKFNKMQIDLEAEITQVLVLMDLTFSAFETIKKIRPNLIITRHPFIFNELEKEKNSATKKLMIKYLTENNIFVYSIHTNYDYCGVEQFKNLLLLHLPIKKISKPFLANDYLKVHLINKITINDLVSKLKTCFDTKDVIINGNGDIKNQTDCFLINQGSGAEAIKRNKLTNCIFITGEAKWSDWIYANDNQICLIAVGHYMENYFVSDIEKRLSNNFTKIQITQFDIKNQYKKI